MRIAVFLPNWVGDAAMATPALRALRGHFPAARFVGVMKPAIADTLAGNPWLDETVLFDPKSPRRERRTTAVRRDLRARGLDLAALFTNSLRSAVLAWRAGAKRRIGYTREFRGLLLTDRLKPKRDRRGFVPAPMVDYYLDLAYALGAPREAPRLELFVSADDERRADEFLREVGFRPDHPLVALNSGAAFGPAKRWPAGSFAELARRLAEERCKVVALCGPGEEGFADYIAAASGRSGSVASLSGTPLSLGLTKALVKRAAALVTTDSGPRHFAAAFGTPVVSLFGPTHQAWTDTYYIGETRLQRAVPCGPCQQRVCPLGHHRCMTDLGVDEVFAATMRALGGSPLARAA